MLLIMILTVLLCSPTAHSWMKAKARVHLNGHKEIIGHIEFSQGSENASVIVRGDLANMPPNTVHGFHVHATPLEAGEFNCSAAGAHFNPYGTPHGPPTADIMNRHVGDLGNVTSDSAGRVHFAIQDSIIQLYNATQSIANRTIVLHAMRDDGGQGGFEDSTTTGNAGARVACGTIVLKKPWAEE